MSRGRLRLLLGISGVWEQGFWVQGLLFYGLKSDFTDMSRACCICELMVAFCRFVGIGRGPVAGTIKLFYLPLNPKTMWQSLALAGIQRLQVFKTVSHTSALNIQKTQ